MSLSEIFYSFCNIALPLLYIHLWIAHSRLQKRFDELEAKQL